MSTRKTKRNSATARNRPGTFVRPYRLEDQVGFLLRQVNQRHFSIFAEGICAQLTPTQFAALAKLHEHGPLSQNRLGRLTAMDAATIKGVIDRLTQRKFTAVRPDVSDARLLIVDLSQKGRLLLKSAIPLALRISAKTLSPLRGGERRTLLKLLRKLC
jgi:DNA-binding MarR family transcriptional regulator